MDCNLHIKEYLSPKFKQICKNSSKPSYFFLYFVALNSMYTSQFSLLVFELQGHRERVFLRGCWVIL